jgi:hypothetical protein
MHEPEEEMTDEHALEQVEDTIDPWARFFDIMTGTEE